MHGVMGWGGAFLRGQGIEHAEEMAAFHKREVAEKARRKYRPVIYFEELVTVVGGKDCGVGNQKLQWRKIEVPFVEDESADRPSRTHHVYADADPQIWRQMRQEAENRPNMHLQENLFVGEF